MPYTKINTYLKEELPTNGVLELEYPEGKNQGSFFGGTDHKLATEKRIFKCPRDFAIVFAKERIIIHWSSNFSIRSETLLYFQLHEQGDEFYTDVKSGKRIDGMVEARTFMVNLGALKEPTPTFFIDNEKTEEEYEPVHQLKIKSDYPRNLVLTCDSNESSTLFRIEGTDIYNRKMVEHIKGSNQDITVGSKAFKTVEEVTANQITRGKFSLGTGDKFGLPVFIPSPAHLLSEVINGHRVTGGKITQGEVNAPRPTLGDRRGTYTPPENVEINGSNSIQLFFILPNPGNIGDPDYSGE